MRQHEKNLENMIKEKRTHKKTILHKSIDMNYLI